MFLYWLKKTRTLLTEIINVFSNGCLSWKSVRLHQKYTLIRKAFPHGKGWKINSGVDTYSKLPYLLSACSTFSNLALYIWENRHMVLSVIVAKFLQERYQLVSAWFSPVTSKGVSITERSKHLLSATRTLP